MEQLLQLLKDLGIDYKKYEHEPLHTMEDFKNGDFEFSGVLCKNFFLKDAKVHWSLYR